MKAIIIGAGRGIRLMPTTANTPKCFAEVKGRRILDWALAAFRANGLVDIVFIGGYQIDKVRVERLALLRGEIKPRSTNSLEVSSEEWRKLVGSEERVYTNLSLPGGGSKSRSKRSSEPEKPSQ